MKILLQTYFVAIKQTIWRKLAFTPEKEISSSSHDAEIMKMLEGDVTKYNVPTLRKIVSCVTQKSVGKYKCLNTEYFSIHTILEYKMVVYSATSLSGVSINGEPL